MKSRGFGRCRVYLVGAAREGREGHILDRAARVFDDRLEGNAVEGDSVVGEGNAHHVLTRNANRVSFCVLLRNWTGDT